MQLILDQRETGGRRKNRLQERFDKLRDRLERERRRHERFRQDLDALVETYHQRLLENDKLAFDELVALSGKLIEFAARKSLSDWHRDELDDWLQDLIELRIQQVDRQAAEGLRQAYRQAIARSMGISVDEFNQILEGETEVAQAESQTAGDTDSDGLFDDEPWQDDLFGFDDDEPQSEAFKEDPELDEPEWLRDPADPRVASSIMAGRWAKDLFRRAAQALHPDREPDPERRHAKQELMRELLQARKQGDIMVMLTIYGDSVSGADMVVAENEMNEICAALEHQLRALEFDREEYIHAHPSRQTVFEFFYHPTRKERTRRLERWQQSLKHDKQELRELVAFLRNLDCLKRALEHRRQERESILSELKFDAKPF